MEGHTLDVSSSGGGLFGRPMIRKGHGALLNFWGDFPPCITNPGDLHLFTFSRTRVLFPSDSRWVAREIFPVPSIVNKTVP